MRTTIIIYIHLQKFDTNILPIWERKVDPLSNSPLAHTSHRIQQNKESKTSSKKNDQQRDNDQKKEYQKKNVYTLLSLERESDRPSAKFAKAPKRQRAQLTSRRARARVSAFPR